MEKIFVIGLALASLLGAGAVGSMMAGAEYDIGMMQGNYRGIVPRGCSMMNVEEIHSLHEAGEEYMEDHCRGLTYEECEEHMHRYCEHDDAFGEGKSSWPGCPMMR